MMFKRNVVRLVGRARQRLDQSIGMATAIALTIMCRGNCFIKADAALVHETMSTDTMTGQI